MRMQIHFEPRELWKFWKKEFPDHDFTSKVRYLTWKDCMKRGREKKKLYSILIPTSILTREWSQTLGIPTDLYSSVSYWSGLVWAGLNIYMNQRTLIYVYMYIPIYDYYDHYLGYRQDYQIIRPLFF